jgi:hypothetical protein
MCTTLLQIKLILTRRTPRIDRLPKCALHWHLYCGFLIEIAKTFLEWLSSYFLGSHIFVFMYTVWGRTNSWRERWAKEGLHFLAEIDGQSFGFTCTANSFSAFHALPCAVCRAYSCKKLNILLQSSNQSSKKGIAQSSGNQPLCPPPGRLADMI